MCTCSSKCTVHVKDKGSMTHKFAKHPGCLEKKLDHCDLKSQIMKTKYEIKFLAILQSVISNYKASGNNRKSGLQYLFLISLTGRC